MKWVRHDRWNLGIHALCSFDGTDAEALTKQDRLRMKLDYALPRISRLIPGWEKAFIARASQRIGLRGNAGAVSGHDVDEG